MKYVKQAAESGIAILGICNGFQILTEMNLLPGILLKNSSLMFICDWINLKVNNNNTMFHFNHRLIIALVKCVFFFSGLPAAKRPAFFFRDFPKPLKKHWAGPPNLAAFGGR